MLPAAVIAALLLGVSVQGRGAAGHKPIAGLEAFRPPRLRPWGVGRSLARAARQVSQAVKKAKMIVPETWPSGWPSPAW